jgi:hypothetical protein
MSSIYYRVLMTSTADTLQWADVEQEIVTDWPSDMSGISVSAWDGMLGVTYLPFIRQDG